MLDDKVTVKVLKEKFPDSLKKIEDNNGNLSITISRDSLIPVCETLKDNPELDYDLLLDLCGVDYLGKREERFEAVYHLYSIDKKQRLRLKVPLPENDPVADSITPLWKTANWFEREAYEMFGIKFRGHPNLTRLLTHDNFQGHPLRKDYPPDKRHKCTTVREYLKEEFKELEGERTILNIGPSHPTMHGVFRVQVMLEGETIVDAESEIGYLHRCFEKMAETHTYHGVIPYTDRLNYCSAFMNNVGYAMAVEKLMGIEVPKRAQYIRVVLSEFSRIIDHQVCIGANLVDLGALTNFWYFFRPREEVYSLIEACCGSRLTTNYVRIGGLADDIPANFQSMANKILDELPRFLNDVDTLNTKNVIFQNRTRGVGAISKEDAINCGFTGPCLRAAGVPYDVRKAHPYYDYDKFEFEIPTGTNGDTYDRYLVRMEEIRQSMKIIRQALDNMPDGPFQSDDKRVLLPPKDETYTNIEALMNHFKLIMHGILPEPGEIYSYTEAANGELGFYIISDGSKNPYRIKVRPPCFPLYQTFPQLIKGGMISDAIAILGSLNIIAGEIDR